jgi:hypothetical protein
MAEMQRHDLTRVVLMVLFIGGLIVASFWLLRPFIAPTIWAVMIVVPTWQAMLAMERFGGGRRWVAVTIMTFILFLLLIVPLSVAIGTIISHLDDITAEGIAGFNVPPRRRRAAGNPPSAPADGPWQEVSNEGIVVLRDKVAPYARGLVAWFVAGWQLRQALRAVRAHRGRRRDPVGLGRRPADWMLRWRAPAASAAKRRSTWPGSNPQRGARRHRHRAGATAVGGVGGSRGYPPFGPDRADVPSGRSADRRGAGAHRAVVWLYWAVPRHARFSWSSRSGSHARQLAPFLIKQGAAELRCSYLHWRDGGLIAFGLIGIFIGPPVLAVAHTLLNACARRPRSETPTPKIG